MRLIIIGVVVKTGWGRAEDTEAMMKEDEVMMSVVCRKDDVENKISLKVPCKPT